MHFAQSAPEDGARAAQSHGGGDADDVAGAQSGGQGGGEGGEGRQILAGVVRFAKRELQRIEKIALRKMQFQREINVGSHQQCEKGKAPDQVVESFKQCHRR